MGKRKWLLLISGIFLVAALVAGCGSVTGKAANTAAQDTFTYAMSGQYRPFNYYDSNKQLTGFDVEIGKALAEKMGMKPEPRAMPWEGLISALKAKKFDAILGSMTITPEREKEVAFSDPYYISGPELFVRKDSSIKSIKDIKKNTPVGVLISSVYDKEARQYSNNVKNYTSDITALQDLSHGRVDAVITDRFVGRMAAGEQKLDIKPVGGLIFVERVGIAFRKGDPLREKVNKALAEIKADGNYRQISEKYFNTDISKP
ncbi:ABC transporter substrate-binding protein [Desulfotomaculum copahuensis]|uniref:ABC transporter substrate-binding protein n=1 Tax=Desulfotomaculum copahuensis TaxID=1838280 RepID=A0A1B7LAI9_9FIRM|nr:ABC transporter substrate-binding protein [Desulfotomaculum copahuensis]OAT79352.1 ABC transporter substrate-binding protein [Desulfotomaculum copahuensis]